MSDDDENTVDVVAPASSSSPSSITTPRISNVQQQQQQQHRCGDDDDDIIRLPPATAAVASSNVLVSSIRKEGHSVARFSSETESPLLVQWPSPASPASAFSLLSYGASASSLQHQSREENQQSNPKQHHSSSASYVLEQSQPLVSSILQAVFTRSKDVGVESPSQSSMTANTTATTTTRTTSAGRSSSNRSCVVSDATRHKLPFWPNRLRLMYATASPLQRFGMQFNFSLGAIRRRSH